MLVQSDGLIPSRVWPVLRRETSQRKRREIHSVHLVFFFENNIFKQWYLKIIIKKDFRILVLKPHKLIKNVHLVFRVFNGIQIGNSFSNCLCCVFVCNKIFLIRASVCYLFVHYLQPARDYQMKTILQSKSGTFTHRTQVDILINVHCPFSINKLKHEFPC